MKSKTRNILLLAIFAIIGLAYIDKTPNYVDDPANTPDYIKAHKHSSLHRAELYSSKNCGCFNCLKIYSPEKIEIWVDEDTSEVSQTAICPFCGIDAVIGDKSGYQISEQFLKKMNSHWF